MSSNTDHPVESSADLLMDALTRKWKFLVCNKNLKKKFFFKESLWQTIGSFTLDALNSIKAPLLQRRSSMVLSFAAWTSKFLCCLSPDTNKKVRFSRPASTEWCRHHVTLSQSHSRQRPSETLAGACAGKMVPVTGGAHCPHLGLSLVCSPCGAKGWTWLVYTSLCESEGRV